MRTRLALQSLLLSVITVTVVACSGSKPVAEPQASPVSVEQVRRYAERAMDGNLSSDQRLQARDSAMRALLEFLSTPAGVHSPKSDWERPTVPGVVPLVRYFETGRLSVYAMALPVPGVVPPGERVAVQFTPASGLPEASELTTLPGSQVIGVQALEENGQYRLIVVSSLARGGGYLAHYQLDHSSGDFRLNSEVFRGLPAKAGEMTLDLRDPFLVVSSPSPTWRPRFDVKSKLRLFVDPDIALEWKDGKFTLLDERRFNALQGFQIALDSKVSKPERDEAWEKAIRKLPTYLREMESWTEDLTAKLPSGATISRDQLANMAVRVISIPSPEWSGQRSFTVIQHRSGGGLPSAQEVSLPGVVESFRVVSRQGLPGLLILSDGTLRGGIPNAPKRKIITLLRQTSGTDWEPAPDWFGFLPSDPTWLIQRSQISSHLTIEATPGAGVPASEPGVRLSTGPGPSVQVCQETRNCFSLNWTGDVLSGTDWVVRKLRAIEGTGAGPVTQQQVVDATHAVQQFLSSQDSENLSAAELSAMLGRSAGVAIDAFDAEMSTKVVGMPPNPSGDVPLLVSTRRNVVWESPASGVVERWVGARALEAGGSRWLLVLGRARDGAVVVVYKWTGNGWSAAPALDGKFDRFIAQRIRVTFMPGQTVPVRGIFAYGGADLTATFTPDGKGVSLCEGERACLTYQFDTRWFLR